MKIAVNARKSILMVLDITAFLLTAAFSYHHTLAEDTSVDAASAGRLALILLLTAAFALLYFVHKGHYGVKIPWWQQVRHIIRAFVLLLFGNLLVNYIAFPTVSGQRWIVLFWLLSVQNILIARWVSRYLLKKMGKWDLPAILLGGRQQCVRNVVCFKV